MDPYFEQKLREEVIYLHSLWHQGKNPNFHPHHNPSFHLHPSNSTHFKKERKRGKRGRKWKNGPPGSDPPLISDIEWPCNSQPDTPPVTSSGWPVLNLPSTRPTRLPSAEEQARFVSNQVQQKALKTAQEFFKTNADDSDGDGDGEDEDMMDEDGDEELKEYEFFSNMFLGDSELRGLYEKNYERGEFCCLVCGGVGKKVRKRFKDCVALVQHSVSIAKTTKKRAHRAFGQAICKVLGWDINRLPTIVSSLVDPVSRSSVKLGESQGNADDGGKEDSIVIPNNVDGLNVDNGELVSKFDSNASEVVLDTAVELVNAVDGELMVCENSLMVADANKIVENLDKEVADIAEGNAEGMVNCLEPLKEDGVGRGGNEVEDSQKDNVVLDGLKVVLDGLKEDAENQN